jgi:tetratricopeptide (TPR) repeat protein
MVKKQPSDLVARLRLAQDYEETKDWAKAAESYEAVMKINPKLASAPLKLAQIYSGQIPNKEKALVYAKTARSLAPNDPKTSAVLGRIAFDLGDFTWSYDLLREAGRQLASDPAVLHDLAWSAYSIGKANEARDNMERSLTAAPNGNSAHEARTFLAMTAGETDPAAPLPSQAEVDSQLKVNPRYVPALMAAARIALQRGDKASAMSRYQTALQRFPDSASVEKQLALLYANDPAHVGEAYELADKARKALPEDPDVARLLGRLCYERKDYPRAIQLLEESGRKQPLDAAGLCYLGLSRLASNQKASGREALNQALANGLGDPLATQAKKALATSDHP